MTPLAHKIIRELTVPLKDRRFADDAEIRPRMNDFHCFEVTKVYDLARELGAGLAKQGVPDLAAFLPAPRTWLEFADASGRIGLFLEELAGGNACRVTISADAEGHFGSQTGMILNLEADRRVVQINSRLPKVTPDFAMVIFALLAMINSPRVMGRKQHIAHAGLQRQLAHAKGLVGKFPLYAWTEIELVAFQMIHQPDGQVHEAQYTGEKCLHFCRAHVRIQNGKLVVVQAHWRGNPALGTKRTRYTVVPPKSGIQPGKAA